MSVPLKFHGPNWNHRRFDLRRAACLLVHPDAEAGSTLAATTGGVCQDQCRFNAAGFHRNSGGSFDNDGSPASNF